MRALVIDDAKSIRMILSQQLKELGFEVHEAADGREALTCLERIGATDLVLCDWNMPGMNGDDFLHALRADSRYAGVRVMMVTTESDMAHVKQALKSGADEYVMKPFTKDIIREKLVLMGLAVG